MKVGSIVYATDQGLGYLAKHLYDLGVIDEVLVALHARRANHLHWYPDAPTLNLSPIDTQQVCRFLDRIDVLLVLETPFWWPCLDICRSKGKKSVLVTMYECTPCPVPCLPDAVIYPSVLDYEYLKEDFRGMKQIYLPVPTRARWKLRHKAVKFVHYAGNGGLHGRNGTSILVEALPMIRKEVKIDIYAQEPLRCLEHIPECACEVRVYVGTVPQEKMWDDYDVFIFPEKFNGLSLPLQEALASGLLVISTKRTPNIYYLPLDPLIPVYTQKLVKCSREVLACIVRSRDLAEAINWWYGKDITRYSLRGRYWAEIMDEKVLAKAWRKCLELLVC